MNGSPTGVEVPAVPAKLNIYSAETAAAAAHPVSDELSILRRENQDLKLELVKMKMKMREFEKPSISSPQTNTQLQPNAEKPPLPKKSFINSVSKRLGRLYPFVRADGVTSKGRVRPAKDRRHSIS
uniref:Uncharacterized protein n=2 Tax=Cucumis sativus TaxID=3659 RepID=A0A0A0LLT4_CUCSA